MTGVVIVGLHRGGTSAIAGILHSLGAYMGSHLLPPSEHNPKGYYEDSGIVKLHNEMIGGNWRHPSTAFPPIDIGHVPAVYNRYILAINDFARHSFWAIKDPRVCFCLPALRAIVPDLKIITVYRDPWYTAASLAKRDDMELRHALSISLRYLEEILIRTRGKSQLRLRFSDAIVKPTEAVDAIANYLGVTPTPEAYGTIDPALAHWESRDAGNIIEAQLKAMREG